MIIEKSTVFRHNKLNRFVSMKQFHFKEVYDAVGWYI